MNRMLMLAGTLLTALLVAAAPARAEPALQLYIEGATYDTTTETWVFSGTDPFTLWAIGYVDHTGPITNVRLSAVYDKSVITGPVSISLTPVLTEGYGGFTDPSYAANPDYLQTVGDGSTPVLGDGSYLPNHGEYGADKEWQEFGLGDFTLTDSPIGDFMTTVPDGTDPNKQDKAQINAYQIVVSGLEAGSFVHFDLYDTIISGNKARAIFAPFSHDAEGDPNGIPAPGPLALMLVGLGLIGFARRRA
ncbi:choice-of-anchor N protein [Caenispirillum salinarum]|uniref:choice-of-anchor N protein n=1 Tax=Caenispirillum salinarum TaxID=859058 RepID=UPI00384E511B